MYIETSTPRVPGDVARLISPSFPPVAGGGETCARFYYHMYGSTIGRLNVYIKDEDGDITTPAWTRAAQKGNEWLPANINVYPLGKRYQVCMTYRLPACFPSLVDQSL